MPKSPIYGTHHEEVEMAARLHQLAEAEAPPAERDRRRLMRVALRLEGPFLERLAGTFEAGLGWLRRPRD